MNVHQFARDYGLIIRREACFWVLEPADPASYAGGFMDRVMADSRLSDISAVQRDDFSLYIPLHEAMADQHELPHSRGGAPLASP